MRTTIVVAASLAAVAHAASPWPQSATDQAAAVLAKMNSTQKFIMVHGWGGSYVGDVPSITLSDGTVIPAIVSGLCLPPSSVPSHSSWRCACAHPPPPPPAALHLRPAHSTSTTARRAWPMATATSPAGLPR